VKRRRFLQLAGGAALGGTALWWLRRPAGDAPGPDGALPGVSASDAPVLLAVADVIVPRFGDSPAASEIDLLPRFESLLASSPERATFYARHLPGFAERVRARIPMPGGRPDVELLTRLCERWYDQARREPAPGSAPLVFVALRHDVLQLYYATPAGWRFSGFDGPVHWSAERLAGLG